MTDDRLRATLEFDRMVESLGAFYRVFGARSPGGALFERPGVLAAIVPSCPNRSIVNAAVFTSAQALAETHAELSNAYREAGVRAWTVWVPPDQREVARLLERSGHHLDASPRAMMLDLANARVASATAVDWEYSADVVALATLNEEAYGLPRGEFRDAITALSGSDFVLYMARVDGQPAACVAALDHNADRGIYLVATAPNHQRRGLASELMRQALWDARQRGCETSSLQATRAGYPVYARMGFRDLGPIEMWERRQAALERS